MKDKKEYKKIYRSTDNVKLYGVCGGIAKYLNIDPTIVRILWILLTITTIFTGIILYILFAIIIPKEPIILEDINFDDIDI